MYSSNIHVPSYIWLKFAAEALEIITNKPWNEMWNFTGNDENVCRCKICSYDLNYLWTSFLGTLVKWPGKRKSNGSIYKRSVDTYLCKWRFHSTSPVNNIPVHSLYQWATRPNNVVVPPQNFFGIDWLGMHVKIFWITIQKSYHLRRLVCPLCNPSAH